MLLKGSLTEILDQLDPLVGRFPRFEPGDVELNGLRLRYVDLHSFYWQCHQLFRQGLYGVKLDRPHPVIVDGGAHIGLASLYFALTTDTPTIEAFEADPAIADVLRSNISALGIPGITVHRRALWTDDGGVCFSDNGDDSGHVATQGIRVDSVDLAAVLEAHADTGIDLLKLDVEGAEFALIPHCREQLSLVRNMIIEVHEMHGAPRQSGRLLAVLEEAGFTYVINDLNQATWVADAAPTPFRACPVDRFIFTIFAWRP